MFNIEKKLVTIAIIDSGIDTTKADLDQYVKKSTGFKVNEEGYIVEDQSLKPRHEHGTAVAMIIKHLCKDVNLISVNILNERLATDGRVLIHALEGILDYQPDIIHLSLGTTRWRYKFSLKRIVKHTLKKNIILVAAAENSGLKSYPAYLKDVVGVKGADIKSEKDFYLRKGFFYAPIDARNIPEISELEAGCQAIGTSMAAAYITGHLACIITNKSNCVGEAAVSYLKTNAKNMNQDLGE